MNQVAIWDQTAAVAHRNDDLSWSLFTYWYDGDEYFVSMGAGEVADTQVDEDELPTPEEELDSWRQYAEFVLETGTDPLSNYMVDRTVSHEEAWQVQYERNIYGRASLRGAMRLESPTWQTPDQLPADVRQYFDPADMEFTEFAKALNANGDTSGGAVIDGQLRVVALRVKRTFAVPEEHIAKELRRLAKQHLTQAEA